MPQATSRTVTIVFTDLVGSTELTAAMGVGEADDLRRAHFSTLEAAAVDTGGDVVKNLGDGLMVAYESASAAVAGAVAMQEAVARSNRRPGTPDLAIRVGVSLGEATPEDGDWFGPPVVEAARLCADADGGQILTTEVVRALVGTRTDAEFKPAGLRELKGLPEPVAVCEVAWQHRSPDDAGLPPGLAARPTAFVGRTVELDQLAEAWERARDGERQFLLVAGEPGIGKTRMLVETAARAHAMGGTVLYGRCHEESLTPYQPFVEALAHHGYDFAALAPEVRTGPAPVGVGVGVGADGDRYRLFEAVVDLLSDLGRTAPLMLAVDDLHWADKASLLLVQYLARTATPLPLLLVGTYRETDLARDHPLSDALADLRRERAYTRVPLRGLTDRELAVLVADRAGHEAPHQFVQALHAETEGNPFFAEEVLIHLAESGAIYQRDGKWVSDAGTIDDLGIPEGVRDVIGRRLSRLSEQANRLLTVAAVMGRQFSLRIAERVSGLATEDVLDAIEEAAARQLVAEAPGDPDAFIFTHALIRQTLYEETSTARRLRLHQQAGEAIEATYADDLEPHLGELAYHFSQLAYGGDADKALDYCRRAAERATALHADDEAAGHHRRALQVLEVSDRMGGAEEVDLLIALSGAEHRSFEIEATFAAASRAVEMARTLGDDQRFIRAVAELPLSFSLSGEWVPVLEEALAKAESTDHLVRLRLLTSLWYCLGFAPDTPEERRDALLDEAVYLADGVDGGDALGGIVHLARLFRAGNEADLALNREVIEALEQENRRMGGWHPRIEANLHLARIAIALREGRLDMARAVIEEIETDPRARKSGASTAYRLRMRATLALLEGRLEDAEAFALEGYANGRATNPGFSLTQLGLQLFALRREQGRLAEMEGPLRRLVETSTGQPFLGPAQQAGLALLLFEEGRLDDAAEVAGALVTSGNHLRGDVGTITWANLAEVAAALGDPALCDDLYRRLAPFDGQCVLVAGNSYVNGAVARYLGLCAGAAGRTEEALAHYADSLALTERVGARPWIARTHLDWAETLATAGADAHGARDHAGAALDIATDVGMPKVIARAEAALTALGAG